MPYNVSKCPSIRALQELKEIVEQRCSAANYDSLTKTQNELSTKKEAIKKAVCEQIETYAIDHFKDFGLKKVPVCKRPGRYSSDRSLVSPDIEITKFPGTDALEKAYQKAKDKEHADKKKIDDWYFAALQSVAAHCELPSTPEFKKD